MKLGVVLDLDGTLVDSVYHHVLAWDRALTACGHAVPLADIHRGIGIGGSRLVTWLLGRPPDKLDTISDEHERLFLEQRDRLRATSGATALLDDLRRRNVPTVIATSAESSVRAALMAALGEPDIPTTDADAVGDSKPAANLLLAACDQLDVEPAHAVLIGDSPWDVAAARRVGMQMISVRTGGFGDSALADRGPTTVVDAPINLIGTL
ncbi:MAG: HAD family hydrolase [Actinobacteria bacterium]|nr:HAD family hydrolase [Actinomycetota bacterium]